MNWGKGIMLVLIAFMSFIIVLVVGFFAHSVDLESEDYYLREIAYEGEITSMNNANALSERANIQIDERNLLVVLSAANEYSDVQLWLKRPDDSRGDQHYQIRGTKTFTIPLSELRSGSYKVELMYTVDGKSCLQKEEVYLP